MRCAWALAAVLALARAELRPRRATSARWPFSAPRWPLSPVIDDEWTNNRGGCAIEYNPRGALRPQLSIRLSGLGTGDPAAAAFDALSAAMDRSGASDASPVAAFVDMTTAIGCTPACSAQCLRFIRAYGSRIGHVAIVGRGFSLAYVRLVVRVTRKRDIHVFDDAEAARRWLREVA